MIRSVFWGLALWGLLTMILPVWIHYYLLLGLGTLAFIGLCILGVMFFFDYLEVRYYRKLEETDY